jgi:plasmid stabilization system protein ParE
VGQTRLVRLRYTLPALADLNEVLDYIAARSPQGARRVQTRIQAIIDLLDETPNAAGRSDGASKRGNRSHPLVLDAARPIVSV